MLSCHKARATCRHNDVTCTATDDTSGHLPRAKHKVETAALRAELVKAQGEGKAGLKGKDAAQKEIEALR